MTVRSSKQGTGLAMRIVLVLLAVTLAALWGMYPQMQSEVVNWNDDKLKTETIAAGDTLVQPVTMDAAFDQVSLRVEAIRESKELTLGVKLLSGDKVVAEQEFPLKKVRAKGKLVLDFPTQSAGNYVMEVTASGTGNTKLGGGESFPMQLNDQEQSVGIALRVNYVVTKYNQAILFSAALMLLLALTPWGRKEAQGHA